MTLVTFMMAWLLAATVVLIFWSVIQRGLDALEGEEEKIREKEEL